MANLFAVSQQSSGKSSEVKFSITQLNEYFEFLSNQFPVYVVSNFSEQAIEDCVLKYPLYYRFADENNKVIKSGETKPNLCYFNSIYSENISTYINRITQKFIDKINSPS